MPYPSRRLVTLVSAATLMVAIGSTASARNISISEQRLTAHYREFLFHSSTGASVICALTLESSLHTRTITKVPGRLVGYIIGAAVGGCTGGSARINAETLPWHERYGGFEGDLPTIREVFTNNTSFVFEINLLGIQCRMTGGSVIVDYRRDPINRTLISSPLVGLGFTSSINASLCGIGEVRVGINGNTTTAATVTLI
jgi:hypothetical protein